MTIKQFADTVRLRLNINSQDAPVDVDERVIVAMADTALGGLLPKYLQAFGADVIGSLAVRQYFDVKKDTLSDLKYSDTHGKINSIAGNMGLLSVGLTQDDCCDFMITKPAQQGIYSNLEAGKTKDIKVWQEGGRLYYNNLPFSVKQVVVRAIPSLLSIPIEDSIPMPSDIMDAVIDKVVANIQSNKAEDKPNDGNDNKPTV